MQQEDREDLQREVLAALVDDLLDPSDGGGFKAVDLVAVNDAESVEACSNS